jgi:hypothetical protein
MRGLHRKLAATAACGGDELIQQPWQSSDAAKINVAFVLDAIAIEESLVSPQWDPTVKRRQGSPVPNSIKGPAHLCYWISLQKTNEGAP